MRWSKHSRCLKSNDRKRHHKMLGHRLMKYTLTCCFVGICSLFANSEARASAHLHVQVGHHQHFHGHVGSYGYHRYSCQPRPCGFCSYRPYYYRPRHSYFGLGLGLSFYSPGFSYYSFGTRYNSPFSYSNPAFLYPYPYPAYSYSFSRLAPYNYSYRYFRPSYLSYRSLHLHSQLQGFSHIW